MKSWIRGTALLLVALLAAVGCGGPTETPEQKLEGFKQAHAAIYDAWQGQTPDELKERLSKGMIEPLLSEQLQQQTQGLNQRKMLKEKHIVKSITFNQLDLIEDGDEAITVYADWTVDGIRDHGDIHQVRVSYKKKFHVVRQNGRWMMEKMTD